MNQESARWLFTASEMYPLEDLRPSLLSKVSGDEEFLARVVAVVEEGVRLGPDEAPLESALGEDEVILGCVPPCFGPPGVEPASTSVVVADLDHLPVLHPGNCGQVFVEVANLVSGSGVRAQLLIVGRELSIWCRG